MLRNLKVSAGLDWRSYFFERNKVTVHEESSALWRSAWKNPRRVLDKGMIEELTGCEVTAHNITMPNGELPPVTTDMSLIGQTEFGLFCPFDPDKFVEDVIDPLEKQNCNMTSVQAARVGELTYKLKVDVRAGNVFRVFREGSTRRLIATSEPEPYMP